MRRNLPHPLSQQIREAVRRASEISNQNQLICREKLKTNNDIHKFVERKSREMQSFIGDRQKLYNRLRRCNNPEEVCEIKLARDVLTKQIISIRNDIKLAKGITEREQTMRNDIRIVLTMRDEKRKREQLFRVKNQKRARSYER